MAALLGTPASPDASAGNAAASTSQTSTTLVSSSGAAASTAAVAAAVAQFREPDTVPPVITPLGPGPMFLTPEGGVGIVTSVLVGSTYTDAGNAVPFFGGFSPCHNLLLLEKEP